MKVSIIGCSTCWTDRPTSSYCVNDTLLIDCGEGTMKYYKQAGVDFLNIKNILITHFHVDHTVNLIQYLSQYAFYSDESKCKSVTIYGPKGLKVYLDKLKRISLDLENLNWEDYFNLVEIDSFKTSFKVGDLNITPYPFNHGMLKEIAYIVDDGKTKVGFSGDLNFQDGIIEFLNNCNNAFLICCNMKSTNAHLGYDKYIEIQNQVTTNLYAVHCVDAVYNNEKSLGITCAKHGTIMYF